jgi:type I restriction enzyme S subunit
MSAATTQPKPRTGAASTMVPPGYKRTEAGLVPADWQLHPVQQMGKVLTGKALAANAPGELRPYLRTKNVFDGRIDTNDILTMPMTDAQFDHFRVQHGDVLLNEGQSLELVGRCSIYRNEYSKPCAIQNQLLRFRAHSGVLPEFACHLFRHCQHTGVFARIALQTTSIAHLGGGRFERLVLAWPDTEAEQRAIAEALSDVDGLLGALEALIAKKRAIKQAAMQQLLTGKTRLPGFNGTWETKRLGDVAHIKTGSRNNEDKVPDGQYPFFVRSERVECINTYSHDCEAILVPGEGRIGDIFHYVKGRFDVHQRVYAITRFAQEVSGEFVYFYMAMRFGAWAMQNTVKATVDSLRLPTFRNFTMEIPRTIGEQIAIATVLSDMDAEIAALERRRDKTRAIKQGMMQQLLTGRIRLLSEMVSE